MPSPFSWKRKTFSKRPKHLNVSFTAENTTMGVGSSGFWGVLREQDPLSKCSRTSRHNRHQHTLKLRFVTIPVLTWNNCSLSESLYGHQRQTFKKPWSDPRSAVPELLERVTDNCLIQCFNLSWFVAPFGDTWHPWPTAPAMKKRALVLKYLSRGLLMAPTKRPVYTQGDHRAAVEKPWFNHFKGQRSWTFQTYKTQNNFRKLSVWQKVGICQNNIFYSTRNTQVHLLHLRCVLTLVPRNYCGCFQMSKIEDCAGFCLGGAGDGNFFVHCRMFTKIKLQALWLCQNITGKQNIRLSDRK